MKNVIRHAPTAIAVLVNTLLLVELSNDLYQNTIKPRLRQWKMKRAQKKQAEEELETAPIPNDV
ncbi:MAG: hypothetical protein IKG96_07215 [Bacteroidaceae bacterium]|nr:hypothetical protein [Bacteroidaceae bacterium]